MATLPNRVPRTVWNGQIVDAVPLSSGVATQQPGAAIQITASVAGEVTLELYSGNEIIVTVAVGDNIYPYQVVKATVGTATITRYYNLIG